MVDEDQHRAISVGVWSIFYGQNEQNPGRAAAWEREQRVAQNQVDAARPARAAGRARGAICALGRRFAAARDPAFSAGWHGKDHASAGLAGQPRRTWQPAPGWLGFARRGRERSYAFLALRPDSLRGFPARCEPAGPGPAGAPAPLTI